MTNITRAKEAYWAQKANAKAGGKDWKFTLEEWISWWEEKLGPNWLEKRGRGKSKYVMGRRGDTGLIRQKMLNVLLISKTVKPVA